MMDGLGKVTAKGRWNDCRWARSEEAGRTEWTWKRESLSKVEGVGVTNPASGEVEVNSKKDI